MNRETISDALGGIDSKYIEEAADEPARTGHRWTRTLLPLAACAALIVTAALTLSNPALQSANDCAAAGSGELNTSAVPQDPEAPSTDTSTTSDCGVPESTKGCPLRLNPGAESTWGTCGVLLSPSEFVPMDRDTLLDYYGVHLPIPDILPQLAAVETPDWGLYQRADGEIFFDVNFFSFASEDGTQQLTVGLAKATPLLPDQTPETDQLQLTPVNGRELAVFSPEEDRLYVDWKQDGLSWHLSGTGLDDWDFYTVLKRLTEPN